MSCLSDPVIMSCGGPGTDHRWEALDDSIGITVRWMEEK
jgi:hypothetical protein